MSTTPATPASLVEAAAREAGLAPAAIAAGSDFHGKPTARFSFTGPFTEPDAAKPLILELSEAFAPSTEPLRNGLATHLRALTKRLRNPDPELYVTMTGLPLRFTGFEWPFHRSTSGADTYLVHGTAWLADGNPPAGQVSSGQVQLHAKLSASMTVTFAEIVAAPEQPYAEDFIYNAIRKTFDYGQLELLKSGNRQPVPVTTRYYSRWKNTFVFTETTEDQRIAFLARKAFWLSAVLGAGKPVWLADPRDAQYLNVTEEQLVQDAKALAAAGLVAPAGDPAFAAATPALLAREPEYRAELAESLQSLKPAFNESMRAGLTNM